MTENKAENNETNINYFLEMFKLQDNFNKKFGEDWKSKDYDWINYIFIETAEAVDSLDCYHWKSKQDDLENFKVELIDIWHFLMSHLLTKQADLNKLIEAIEEIWHSDVYRDMSLVDLKEVSQFLAYSALGIKFTSTGKTGIHLQKALLCLFILFKVIGIDSAEKLYQEYLVKNALNIIRQDNGYKTNSYIKIWRELSKLDGVDKQEDNIIAYEISERLLEANNLTLDSLKKELQEYYDRNVQPKQ